jgi:uncharacterized protein YeaO (DUF488 family)
VIGHPAAPKERSAMLAVKRVYDGLGPEDGWCVLVDRLWPRGVTKLELGAVTWLREVAPSADLRRWYRHEKGRWGEFRERYFAELDSKPQVWRPIWVAAHLGPVTLVYSARDVGHNNAVALKEYLEAQEHHRPDPPERRGRA